VTDAASNSISSGSHGAGREIVDLLGRERGFARGGDAFEFGQDRPCDAIAPLGIERADASVKSTRPE
jgi:hypothetical protein